jgi:hypothetical protein
MNSQRVLTPQGPGVETGIALVPPVVDNEC